MDLDYPPAPGELALVQAFLNTADLEGGTDDLERPAALSAWLASHGLLSNTIELTSNDLARAIRVREGLRDLTSANGGAPAPTGVGAAVSAAAGDPAFRLVLSDDGTATLHAASPGLDGALGRLLAIVAAAMADGTWSRLKACRRQRCRFVFYDRTRSRTGAWCSMAVCGNREKAEAFRRRHRT